MQRLGSLVRLLDRALRRMGDLGDQEGACRAAAEAWALLEKARPSEAQRLNGTLHYLTRVRMWPDEPAPSVTRPSAATSSHQPRSGSAPHRKLVRWLIPRKFVSRAQPRACGSVSSLDSRRPQLLSNRWLRPHRDRQRQRPQISSEGSSLKSCPDFKLSRRSWCPRWHGFRSLLA